MRSQRVTRVSYTRHTRRRRRRGLSTLHRTASITVIIIPTMPHNSSRWWSFILFLPTRIRIDNIIYTLRRGGCSSIRLRYEKIFFFFTINYNRSFDLLSDDVLFYFGNIKSRVYNTVIFSY